MITHLQPNEIFVFGSHVTGHHAGGAARQAVERFGAEVGKGEGLQGQSYAIPTMNGQQLFQDAIDRFIGFAIEHPELTFLLTRVGCGIAGYDKQEVIRMFRQATPDGWPVNVIPPEGWTFG
jgi:hypothetical protein